MLNKTQDEITKKWPLGWNEPAVTIRCAVYNHEDYISKALDSFLMQETNFPFEIFVHDDASTDNSAVIIQKYAENFPDIVKPVLEIENQYSKENGSLKKIMWSPKFNRGKYIALCEGDDYWTDPLKLQKQFDFLEQHTDYSFVTCATNVIDETGTFIENNNRYLSKLYGENVEIKNVNEYCDLPHTSSYFFKNFFHKDFASFQGKFEKNYQYYKGWDKSLCLFLLSMGKMFYLADTMSCYRFVKEGKNNWTSLKNTVNKTKTIAAVETAMQIQVKEYGFNFNIKPHFYRNVFMYSALYFARKRTFEDFKLLLYAIKVCPNKINFLFWVLKNRPRTLNLIKMIKERII